jgi:serine/threonine protein kinase/tetratricopeptide (TPR) repeat protein
LTLSPFPWYIFAGRDWENKGTAMSIKCPKCQHENPDDTFYCGKCSSPLKSSEEIDVTATIEAPKEELTTGSTFAGRFQIIEEIGKGGMGRVYKVYDTEIKEKVALKLLKPEIAADQKTVERFRNEIKLARKIVHKNVGRMYDLGREKESFYITMEYVPGQDLRGLIRQSGRLTIETAISLAAQVCDGLEEAHSLGVVHRDLKPSNIMIDQEGSARIMDFGIARSLKGKGITGAGVIIGTPEYMSPEQVDGKETDQRSDIYSLGIILYEMLTGRLPFEGDTPLSIAVQHRSDAPKDPRELNTQIPGDLCRTVLKCLEKEQGNRFQTANELLSDLDKAEMGIPTKTLRSPKQKPITSKEITVSFSAKKLILPILAVAAIVIVGLSLWHPWTQREPPTTSTEKPSIAVLPFKDLSPQKDQQHLCEGIPSDLVRQLAQVEGIRIPGWAQSSTFYSDDMDFKEMGEKLNVETVFTGTLEKADKRLRIKVELINIADSDLIWSERYEQDEGDLFDLQDEVALKIIEKLKVKLLGEERDGLVKRYTDNVQAYNLYQQGRYFWNKRNTGDIKKSIDYYKEAIDIDPNYALAYAGMADSYITLTVYDRSIGREYFPLAKEAANRALEIDDMLAEAHSALAMVLASARNIDEAEMEFKRAIELDPNYANAHHWYAYMLVHLGRTDEALKEINRAHELDPVSFIISRNVGFFHFLARKHDKAIEATKKTLALKPDYHLMHVQLFGIYAENSMYEEALSELEKIQKTVDEEFDLRAYYGLIYALTGKKEHAEQILSDLIAEAEHEIIEMTGIMRLCIALGKTDQAFMWLDKIVAKRGIPIDIIVAPAYDGIRDDPRFEVYIQKLGINDQP